MGLWPRIKAAWAAYQAPETQPPGAAEDTGRAAHVAGAETNQGRRTLRRRRMTEGRWEAPCALLTAAPCHAYLGLSLLPSSACFPPHAVSFSRSRWLPDLSHAIACTPRTGSIHARSLARSLAHSHAHARTHARMHSHTRTYTAHWQSAPGPGPALLLPRGLLPCPVTSPQCPYHVHITSPSRPRHAPVPSRPVTPISRPHPIFITSPSRPRHVQFTSP
jgi:hypothetical protein